MRRWRDSEPTRRTHLIPHCTASSISNVIDNLYNSATVPTQPRIRECSQPRRRQQNRTANATTHHLKHIKYSRLLRQRIQTTARNTAIVCPSVTCWYCVKNDPWWKVKNADALQSLYRHYKFKVLPRGLHSWAPGSSFLAKIRLIDKL